MAKGGGSRGGCRARAAASAAEEMALAALVNRVLVVEVVAVSACAVTWRRLEAQR